MIVPITPPATAPNAPYFDPLVDKPAIAPPIPAPTAPAIIEGVILFFGLVIYESMLSINLEGGVGYGW